MIKIVVVFFSVLLGVAVTSCAFIQEGSVAVVKSEPTNCEFIRYLGQALEDSWEEGINKLKRDTIRAGGNTLYLPADKQTVLRKSIGSRYLSIGSAFLCPDD